VRVGAGDDAVRAADDGDTVKVAAAGGEAIKEVAKSGKTDEAPIRVVDGEQSKDLAVGGREGGGSGKAKEVIDIEETQDDGEVASKAKEVAAASKKK